jgi:hypothetical protein
MSVPSEVSAPSRGARRLRAPVLVVVALVSVLAGLGISVAVVAGIAQGVHASADQLTSAKTTTPQGRTVTESMDLYMTMTNPSIPTFTHTTWTVRKGETVVLTITSHDNGVTPLVGAQTMFDNVQGTLGGTETVDGKTVRAIPNSNIAHTFTVVGLGLNVPIPAVDAPGMGGPNGPSHTIVVRFVPTRTGLFVWQCYAPCGTGPNGTGGAMATDGQMEGTVRVLS